MKKIVFFSGSRAEYNVQYPIIKKFQNSKLFKVYFIIAGSHTSDVVGDTSEQIKKDKVKIFHRIELNLNSKDNLNLNIYSIELQKKISKIINKIRPDCIFLTSDRFETLSVALVSHFMCIPIIHLEGGDVTEGGTLDDNTRHAITKLSSIHFVTNKDSKKRIIRMGEEKFRIHDIGFPPLNIIEKKKLFSKKYIENQFKIEESQNVILFTLHPVPNEINKISIVFKAIQSLNKQNIKFIITYPNFDPGYLNVIREIKKISKNKKNIIVVKNLGRKMYFSILNYLGTFNKGICLGNSSSGIKETMFFNCKTLNLGSRQESRFKTNNILDCNLNLQKIISEVKKLLKIKVNYQILNNPYYSKNRFNNLDKKILNIFKNKKFYQKKITY